MKAARFQRPGAIVVSPSFIDEFDNLLLLLGRARGSLLRPDLRAELVDALRSNTVSRGYVVSLRDGLSAVLDESS